MAAGTRFASLKLGAWHLLNNDSGLVCIKGKVEWARQMLNS